jgi:hypothetical protein
MIMKKENKALPFPEIEATDNKGFLSLFEEKVTKKSIAKHALDVLARIDGDSDPLDVYIKAKSLQEYLTVMMGAIKEDAISEADKYGRDDNTMFGIKFECASTPRRYDYSNNKEWSLLQEQITELKKKQLEIEDKMKRAIGTGGIIDEESGEVLEPPNVTSGGNTTLKISIPTK